MTSTTVTTTSSIFGLPCPTWCQGEHQIDQLTDTGAKAWNHDNEGDLPEVVGHVEQHHERSIFSDHHTIAVGLSRDDVQDSTADRALVGRDLIYVTVEDRYLSPQRARELAAKLLEAADLAD